MTISSSNRKAGPFTGNGVTVAFPFAFKVFTTADVLVVQAVTATGVETTLALGTNYTVSLNADQNANPGGTITMLVAPPTGSTLTATSQVGNLQPMDLTNAGGFYPKVLNDAADRAAIQIQQTDAKADRSLKYPVSDSGGTPTMPGKAQRLGRVLAFHETTGDPVQGPSVSDVGTVVGNVADISTVANNLNGANTIGTVAGSIGNVNAVGNNISSVNTVADNTSNVTVVASNIAGVNNVSNAITAGALLTGVYQGAFAFNPSTRLNGSALQAGDIYFNTSTHRMMAYASGTWYATETAGATDAALVTYDSATVEQRLNRLLHIEGDNFRDFWNKLTVFNDSEDGNITVSSYGDSVSWDVAVAFAWYLKSEFGTINPSTWTPVEFGNALVTPTGTEAGASRAAGSRIAPTLAGGATAYSLGDGVLTDPVYMPNSDLHYVIPAGGTAIWNPFAATIGFHRILCFLAIEPGAGTCTVEVLDQTNAVIATQTIDCANATLGATKAEFTGLDTSKTYKLKVTGLTGTVRSLGAVMMFRRGITMLCWRWGGSTYIQQNKSSKVIFDYINNALHTAIMFAETKGEDTFSGVVSGVDGLADACTRMNALACSKVLIGSRPDIGLEATQYDAIYRHRDLAVANDYVFVDGYNLLGSYAELQRLVWDRRNNVVEGVHLPLITAYYVAGQLINRIPKGFIKNTRYTGKVVNDKVSSRLFSIVLETRPLDDTLTIPVIIPYPSDPSVLLAKIQNVSSYKVKNPYSAAQAEMAMYGGELNLDTQLRVPTINQVGGVCFWAGEQRYSGQINSSGYTGTNLFGGNISCSKQIGMGNYTVATLPAGLSFGALAYATNGRKVGEGAGAGTGVMCYYSNPSGLWRRFSDDTQVAA